MSRVSEFQADRQKLNELVMKYAGRNTKRFYSVDWQAYEPGALPGKTKELLGLVASLVLRCDDCVTYHVINCFEAGVSDGEIEEALGIGLVVGGSITIPHLRRAFRTWDELKSSRQTAGNPEAEKPRATADERRRHKRHGLNVQRDGRSLRIRRGEI